jgi:hypothetical protein
VHHLGLTYARALDEGSAGRTRTPIVYRPGKAVCASGNLSMTYRAATCSAIHVPEKCAHQVGCSMPAATCTCHSLEAPVSHLQRAQLSHLTPYAQIVTSLPGRPCCPTRARNRISATETHSPRPPAKKAASQGCIQRRIQWLHYAWPTSCELLTPSPTRRLRRTRSPPPPMDRVNAPPQLFS